MSLVTDVIFRGQQREVQFEMEGSSALIWSFVEPEADDPTGEDYITDAEREALETELWKYIDDYYSGDDR